MTREMLRTEQVVESYSAARLKSRKQIRNLFKYFQRGWNKERQGTQKLVLQANQTTFQQIDQAASRHLYR